MKKILFMICMFIFPLVVFADKVSIDGVEYTHLQEEEVKAALTEGKTLKFEAVDEDSDRVTWTLYDLENVTIDLNGQTNVEGLKVSGRGVTITDSVGNGAIERLEVGPEIVAAVEGLPDATITIKDIKIKNDFVVNSHTVATIINVTVESSTAIKGEATINSGTFKKQIDNSGDLTIKNITSNVEVGSNVYNKAGSKVVIENGTFTSANSFLDCGDLLGDATCTVKNATVNASHLFGINSNGSVVNVYGGTYNVDTMSFQFGTLNLYGGKVTSHDELVSFKTFNFGTPSEEPIKDDPILINKNAKIIFSNTVFHFYGGTMYLKGEIMNSTAGYTSEVKLYDLVYEKQTDGSYKAYLKSSKPAGDKSSDSTPKYSCQKANGYFYDKNGNKVTKTEYENSCKEPVVDTGFVIPVVSVIALVTGYIVVRKRKSVLNNI